MAIIRGDEGLVKLLLEHGANVNVDIVTDNGEKTTPLLMAIDKGNLAIVKLLVDHDADINMQQNGITPLFRAFIKKINRW